jgi:hypothetical protein
MAMHRGLGMPRTHVIIRRKISKTGFTYRESACGRSGVDVLEVRGSSIAGETICATCLRQLGRAVERLVGVRRLVTYPVRYNGKTIRVTVPDAEGR